jgi:DNA gyrase/topoisomerase IV subunit A
LISPDKIDEWIREVEERPASAELIIRYIARRLSELAERDEELVAQNIELLSGRKVEEYESRIASLEYQLELLKRQLGGEVVLPTEVPNPVPIQEKINLLVYNPLGQVLCLELDPKQLSSGQKVGQVIGEAALDEMLPDVLTSSSLEELLFIFDTGRTVRRPVTQLPKMDGEQLDWRNAFLEEPRVKEKLAAIQPIGKMPLFELCIQASRRGYVKKMKTAFFTAHLEEDYIGSGVKVRADQTCGLTFTNPGVLFVMVSAEGYIFSMPVEKLPTAIENVVLLGNTDHIVSAFIIRQTDSLLFITRNGKAVHRESRWLEPANSFKSHGQSILSRERREAGTRFVAAVPVGEVDWGVILHDSGILTVHDLNDLISMGSVLGNQPAEPILGMSVFQNPKQEA